MACENKNNNSIQNRSISSVKELSERFVRITLPPTRTRFQNIQIAESNVSVTNGEVIQYAQYLASKLLGRTLNAGELASLQQSGLSELSNILTAWSLGQEYQTSVALYYEQKLAVGGGSIEGVNFNKPRFLIKHILSKNLPLAELLTASYEVDENSQIENCPHGAGNCMGLMTQKAFLRSSSSRFNLRRAGSLLDTFLCRDVPLSNDLNPLEDKSLLIQAFAAENLDEVPPGAQNVVNGSNCYSCHGHFAPFTQLFVKFDNKGQYQPSATGLQDPSLAFGEASNNMATSHYKGTHAGEINIKLLGSNIKTMTAAAELIVSKDEFAQCMIKNSLSQVFERYNSDKLTDDLIKYYFEKTQAKAQELKYTDILVHVLASPFLVKWMVEKD